MEQRGPRSPDAEAHDETLEEHSPDDAVYPRTGTHPSRLRSEVHVPNNSFRRRSRVRVADLSDDTFYTCPSEDEEEELFDTGNCVDRRHVCRNETVRNGDNRVSRQGGESHGSA